MDQNNYTTEKNEKPAPPSTQKVQQTIGSYITTISKTTKASSGQTSTSTSSSTPSEKPSSSSSKANILLTDYEKRIRTQSLNTIVTQQNHAVEDISRICRKFIEMAELNKSITLPNQEKYNQLTDLQSELKELNNKKPKPTNYFRQAAMLEMQIKALAPIVKQSFLEITLATDAYHCCNVGMKECMEKNNYIEGVQWEDLRNALVKIGVKEYLDSLEKKRNNEKAMKKNNKHKNERKRSLDTLSNAARSMENETKEEDDYNVSASQVIDLDGRTLNINEELNRGDKCKRSGNLVQRKVTPNKNKRVLRNAEGKVLTQAGLVRLLNSSWEGLRFKGDGSKQKFSGSSKKGHGLVLVNDRLFCNLCNVPVCKVSQHLCTEKHQNAYINRLQRSNNNSDVNPAVATTAALSQAHQEANVRNENNLRGRTNTLSDIIYRKYILKTALQANLSMGQLQIFSPALDAKGNINPNIGHASNLCSDYIGPVRSDERKLIKDMIGESYKEFSLTVDGSPIGNDAEAITLRLVNKITKKVSDVIISVKLYGKKLDGQAIANNVITELGEYGITNFRYWVYCSMDRAGNNGVAIKQLKAKNIANPTYGPCHSHTINLPGKEFNESCSLMNKFRKAWNKSICTRGQLHKEIKKYLGKYPVISGGVRWYVQWEQISEMFDLGIERILNEIVPIGVRNKWSEESIKKMVNLGSQVNLPKLIVEFAVVSQVGRIFCQSTYSLEGDDPIGASCWLIFERLDKYANDGVILSNITAQACDRAGELMSIQSSEVRTGVADELNHARNQLSDINDNITRLSSRIAALSTSDNARRERRRRADYAALNSGNRQQSVPQDVVDISVLEPQLRNEVKQQSALENQINELEARLNDFNDNVGPATAVDFQAHAIQRAQSAFGKYLSLYSPNYFRDTSLDYPLYYSKRAFLSNKIFGILYLKEAIEKQVPLAHLESLVEGLKYHKEESFADSFCEEMKREIPQLLSIVSQHVFDFELQCEENNLCINRIKTRRRRRRNKLAMSVLRSNELGLIDNDTSDSNNPLELLRAFDNNSDENNENDDTLHWSDDVGERGKRIADWWASVMVISDGTWLPCFEKMFILLCLLRQPSSAIVERVFSQINYIRSSCEDKLKEDNLELRTMLRCNGNCDTYEY